jgi:hypothetical protein
MSRRILTAFLFAGALSGCSAATFVPEHQETPPAPVNFVIEISGTSGVSFEGSLGTASASQKIEGQVPVQFTVTTAIAVVTTVTKKVEDGDLTVRVLREGQEVARRTTSAPFGTVILVYTVR